MRVQRFERKLTAEKRFAAFLVTFLASLGAMLLGLDSFEKGQAARRVAGSANLVVTVSAANYEAPVAPDSIVAMFGDGLATSIAVAGTVPLPLSLAGTTVGIRDSLGVLRPARLFFVSPGQVNCVIPGDTAPGTATVTVVAGNAVMSTGTVEVVSVAPGIFTATSDGLGAPAADFLRVFPDFSQAYEPAYQGTPPNFTPRPIDLGPEGQVVFLVMYLTGIRGAPSTDGIPENGSAENVRILVGGLELTPTYAGVAPGYVALDQINVVIPRSLIGRGLINFAVAVAGFDLSNLADIDIATPAGNQPPVVNGVSGPAPLLARDQITINGTGFAANPADNVVRIGGVEAGVEAASPTQLQARVQFGTVTGPLTVATAGGQWTSPGSRTLRTSISGLVRDTFDQPIAGAKVTLLANSSFVFSQPEGWFVLPDTPSGVIAFRIEVPPTVGLSYADLPLKTNVTGLRDNPYPGTVYLQQASGSEITVGGSGLTFSNTGTSKAGTAPETSITTDGVTLTIPDSGFTAMFPGGETSGTLILDVLKQSLTPAPLPQGIFSSAIAQIFPFGVKLDPGARLTFPNVDGLPANAHAKLFKYDLVVGSPTFGTFVDTGKEALVSGDGSIIQTDANAITETSYYFVALPRPLTTIVGRVVDSDGTTPRRGATVRARGQEAKTDGNGGFILRRVPCKEGDPIGVAASLLRSSGRVDRAFKVSPGAVVKGLTRVGDLVLDSPTSNRAPLLYVRDYTEMYVTQTLNLPVTALDLDSGQQITEVVATGAPFVQIIKTGAPLYQLKLQPPPGTEGNYFIGIIAKDSSGETTRREMKLKVKPLPTANAQSLSTSEDVALPITLSGSDASNRPLTIKIKTLPQHGSLGPSAGGMLYTPTQNYNGPDSFTFSVDNGLVESPAATVSITVTPVNDAPVLVVPGPQSAEVGKVLSFGVSASDADTGQSITLLASNLPAGAQFMQNAGTATGTFTWTPSALQAGQFSVTFTAHDNAAPQLSDNKTVLITVTGQGVWRATSGPDGGTITAFLNGGTFLLAGTNGDGIFRSTDNGATWLKVSTGFITSFAIIPGNAVFAGTGVGILRSLDGGQTWNQLNTGLTNGVVTSLINSVGTIYAGTDGGGVFRLNPPATWTAVNTNLGNLSVSALTNVGEVLYAATGSGVFSSVQAQAWNSFNTGLPATRVLSFTVLSTLNGPLIVAGTQGSGVYQRLAAGPQWTSLNLNLTNLRVEALMTDGANFVFAGTRGGGCFRYQVNSPAAGWAAINNGLTNPAVLSLGSTTQTLFAGTLEGGIFRSSDNGNTWLPANNGIPRARVTALTASGSILFAGTNGGGIYASSNSGNTWTGVNSGLTNGVVSSFALSGGNIFAGTVGGGVFRSSNGITWTPVNSGLGSLQIQSLAVSGTNLFAGSDVGTVYISANSGGTWLPASSGLPAASVYTLFANGGFLFAGTNGSGVYRSENNGTSWSPANTGLTNLRISSFATIANTLFVGTIEGGVFSSTNNGVNWSPVNSGLTSQDIYALFASGNSLFAGSKGGGVFTTSNGGTSWTGVQGLAFPFVLTLTANGTALFAGTDGGGVFILQ